jgi:hypothetical protein
VSGAVGVNCSRELGSGSWISDGRAGRRKSRIHAGWVNAERGRPVWPFSDKTWARIGKVALLVGIFGIVGVLANIIKIYEFFAPSGPDLVSSCSYSEYVTSPDNYQMLINIYNIRAGKYTEGIQKALSTLMDEIEKNIAKSGNEKIDELNRKVLTIIQRYYYKR